MRTPFIILLLLLLTSCQVATPPIASRSEALQSLAGPAAPAEIQAPTLHLVWNYPPISNIVFEVWATTNLATAFTLLAVIDQTNFPLNPTNAQQFFKVRARDTITGAVSDWATR